ncbi:hypothetical protein [Gryllotalpicola protaetiae]|uniref:Uncharacterized protein n=1 Tax=Gryllotalpicola protaetiae TaxID=2419771 RepID=A0A387BJR0_9MICO|nr:hypothetical protein [Gryllotalpicola protaetiae]AYG04345.1 hypothetical protein D7I44_12960 [Gryllotalpicola protaetiae]
MTTLTAVPQASISTPSAFDRIWRVVRVHYLSWRMTLLFPWAILIGILGVNIAIWYLIVFASHENHLQTQYTGSLSYLFVYQAIVAVQLMNLSFGYALGMSSTRRDFFLGTGLFFVVHAAQFTAGIVLLTYIEQWTNGWGVGGHMFQTVYLGTGPLGQRVFTVFFGLLAVLFLGSIFGAVFVRWRAYGLYAAFGLVLIVLLGAAAMITFTQSWPEVGAWFVRNRALGVVAWSLPVTALCGAIGFVALRRAIPRG